MFMIEPARMDEVDRLVRIASQAMPGAIDAQHIADEAARDACMVARDVRTDDVLGFALARCEEPCEGHIVALAVDRFHRGEGIGAALLKGVRDRMVRDGALCLRLEVRSDDDRAQAFYARHGFQPEGLQPHVYGDGGDALRLIRPV